MSLFIGLLSFDNDLLHSETKIGVLLGSITSAVFGYALLRMTTRNRAAK
jgi:NhaA family Na+:H+ antiporter